jgi:hypothetical protein
MRLCATLADIFIIRLGTTPAGIFMVRLGTTSAGIFMGMCLCRFSRQ